MPARKKKFIDKKNSVTFHLVHRSQQDPLQADEDAPKRVLLPAERRKEEEHKWGVFYDDEYDYMQHLRDTDELREVGPNEADIAAGLLRVGNDGSVSWVGSQQGDTTEDDDQQINDRLHGGDEPTTSAQQTASKTLTLPSSVFASALETDVGLLNKAVPLRGPQPDWDPDIVAGLDEDFNFDDPSNLLADDFMETANADADDGGGQSRNHSDSDMSDIASDEADVSDVDSNFGQYPAMSDDPFADCETKSRFTAYSMTSSVIRRNNELTLLDERFDKFFEQYDDDEIGALDQEDISGNVDTGNVLLDSIVDQFEEQHKKVTLLDTILPGGTHQEVSDSDSDSIDEIEVDKPQERWDCESILSTYSNIYNHPKMIREPRKVIPIKLTTRANIPADVLPVRGLTRKQVEALDQDSGLLKRDPVPTYRPKDESTEERRQRKKAIKNERQIRRGEKKNTKEAFKNEKKRQEIEILNAQKNIQGMKIV